MIDLIRSQASGCLSLDLSGVVRVCIGCSPCVGIFLLMMGLVSILLVRFHFTPSDGDDSKDPSAPYVRGCIHVYTLSAHSRS